METKTFTKKKKIISLLTVFCILANLFSPFSVLAASPAAGEPYLLVKLHQVQDISGMDPDDIDWDDEDLANYYFEFANEANQSTVENPEDGTMHMVTIDVILKGAATSNAAGFNVTYDDSVLIPGSISTSGRGTKKKATIEEASDYTEFVTEKWTPAPANGLNTPTKSMRLEGSTTSRFSDGQTLLTMTFVLAPGKTFSDITEDVFTLTPAIGLDKGLLICYYPSGNVQHTSEGATYWVPEGFAPSGAIKVSKVSVVDPMTKTKYYNGENLDFTGATVKIEYDDEGTDTDETLSLTQAIADGKVTVDSTEATSAKKVVITAEDETCDLTYNIATAISVDTPPTKSSYIHGDTLDFTGGKILVTYDDSSTETIDMTDAKLTHNRTKADVDHPTIDFTYIDTALAKATLTVTVEDPLDHIDIDTNITSTFSHGDTITGTGGTIKAVTKSGKVTSGIAMTDPSVTLTPSTADVTACTTKWKNGDLDAGNQTITVTYTDAKGTSKSTTTDVVVNDTVTAIVKKSDVTAKNKYNTAASGLNYTGAQITVSTGSGNSFDLNVNSGMVDTTAYDPTKLTAQNLPVTYGGITTTAGSGINLTLTNYINGITVSTAAPVKIDYNQPLDLTGVTYTKDYADGSHSTPIQVTSGMVSGYNTKPGASKFNASHEASQTVTVTLSTADDADVDVIPQTDTFTAITKDKVKGISLNTYPTKVTYKYGDVFDAAGGRINLAYESGATGSVIAMTATGVSITEADGSPINMSPTGTDFGSTHRVNKTLKVTYNDGTTTFTGVTIPVMIKDILDSASITTQPTKAFNHGDTFSVGAGKISLGFVSGNVDVRDLDDGTVIVDKATSSAVNMSPAYSQFDTNNETTKHLRVSYTEDGITKYDDYDITITNNIVSIAVTTEPDTTYNIGDTNYTNLSNGVLTVSRAVGPTATVSLDDTDVSLTALNTLTSSIGTKSVSVGYAGLSTTFDITVQNGVKSISITAPTDTTFDHGDTFTIGGGSIDVEYADGTHTAPTLTTSMITESDGSAVNMSPLASAYDSTTHTLTKNLKITYTEDGVTKVENYSITLSNPIDSIAIGTSPKTKYNLNEATTGVGGTIIATRKAGDSDAPVSITDTMVSGLDTSTPGTGKTATVAYEGKQTTYTYDVVDNVTSIAITIPSEDKYNHGDAIDLTGGSIAVTYASGTTVPVTMTTAMITEADGSPLNMSPASTAYDTTTHTISKNLKITYTENGVTKTETYPITLKNNVTSIAMGTLPSDRTYPINATTYKVSDGDIVVTRAAGDSDTVDLTDSDVSLTPLSTLTGTAGNKNVTVTYEGETTTFGITVTNGVDSITITAPTTDLAFNHGDTLTYGGGDILINYLDGTSRHETITDAMVTEDGSAVNMSPIASAYDSTTHTLTKNLKITYTEGTETATATYSITLSNPIESIAFGTAPATSYNLGATITYPIGDIIVTRKAGDTDTTPVDITSDMVSGLSTATAGTGINASVSYGGKTLNYTYDVTDNITGITITPPSTTTYNHGDSLNLTGGSIVVNYASGTSDPVTMTTDMITDTGSAVNMSPASTAYDSTTHTLAKNLTITYTRGEVTETASYPITIVNNVTGIAMGTLPSDRTYKINDTTYKVSDGDIVVTRAAGDSDTVDLTDSDVSLTPLSTLTGTAGNKDVTVTYGGETTTFSITVTNAVDTITITAPTTDVAFNHGDALTYGGGDILISYLDGTSRHETITDAMVTEGGSAVNMSPASTAYDATTHTLTKNLTITYTEDGKTGTANYAITLSNPIDSIAIGTSPKTSYNLNDPTAGVGGTIIPTRKAGDSDAAVSITDAMVSGLSTATAGTGKTATVTYEGKQTTYTYDVKDNVTGITITAPSTTKYNHGAALDLTGGSIVVSYASGTSNPVTMTEAMITESGSAVNMSPAYADYTNNEVSKTLTITYEENGVTKTESYPITIVNNVTGIAMGTNPTDTTYNVGNTEYKLAGGDIVVTRAVGPTETVSLSDPGITLSDISTITNSASDSKAVTVTYEGQTTSFNVKVQDLVTSISIAGTPKTVYELNDPVDPTLSINVERNSGTSTTAVTSEMMPGFDTSAIGSKTLTITYEGQTTTYTYSVVDSEVSIAIGNPPKKNYKVGDSLDVAGGTIIVTKKSGATETVALTEAMVSDFDSSSVVTDKTLTVTYNGLQTTYKINVTNPVSSIALNPAPSKTTYKYGEDLVLSDAFIDVDYENGTSDRLQVTSSMISGYNKNKLGNQTVTVTFGKNSAGEDRTATFNVKVEDYISKIAVTGAKTSYNYGDPLDLSTGSVNITMASGTPATAVALTDASVSVTGYTPNKAGTQELTVTYETMTTKYNVEVVDYVTNTSITVPSKTTYNYGDSLDLSTGKVVKTWASGKTTDTALTTAMVKEASGANVNMRPTNFGADNKVQKTLKITSDGITEDYEITIINDIKSIIVKQTPKTEYQYGDEIDKTVGSIEVTRGNGQKEEIMLTDPRITIEGFDTSAEATNIPVKIKFTENGATKQTAYSISVNDNVNSISLVGTPKTTYKYGDTLDLTGLSLTVVRPSGTTPNVPVKQSMVSGYNPTKLGTQKVTITYGGKKVSYNVEVVDYVEDIELVRPTKLTYKVGQSLNLKGASITEVMASGAKVTGIPVTKQMVSTLDTSTEGTKTLKVTYVKDGKTFVKSFTVVVTNELSGITVKEFPKDEYLYGDNLDLKGAKLEITLEDGTTQVIPITSDMVSGYKSKPAGSVFADSDEITQIITIKYKKGNKTKKTTYPVVMKDYVSKIKVENLQKEYSYGEKLNIDDATVTKVMASGNKLGKVQLTNDMITGYNPKKLGDQTLTIKYAGKETIEVVTVKDAMTGIAIKKVPNKISYEYGDNIDVTGGKLLIIKRSGTEVIDITKNMIRGYDSNKEGTQNITVKYKGFEAEYSIVVNAKPVTPSEPDTPSDSGNTNNSSSEPSVIVINNYTGTGNDGSTAETPVSETPTTETPAEEKPVTEQPVKQEQTKPQTTTKEKEETPKVVEKPTKVLGEEDRNSNQIDFGKIIKLLIKIIAGIIAAIALIFMLILLFLRRRNVKVYVEEDEEFVLGGLDKVTNDDRSLDIDKYLDGKTYPNRVMVHLNKSISKKLDGKELEIKHRGETIKHKVEYNDEPYEFILDAISTNEETPKEDNMLK